MLLIPATVSTDWGELMAQIIDPDNHCLYGTCLQQPYEPHTQDDCTGTRWKQIPQDAPIFALCMKIDALTAERDARIDAGAVIIHNNRLRAILVESEERAEKAEAERDEAIERAARFQQIVNDNHHLDFGQMTRALRKAEAERDRYRAVVELVGEPGMFACQQPLPRIADEFGTLVEDPCEECWDCRVLATLAVPLVEEKK